jgi:DNA-directed RNA polymerase III subunit RPC3
VLIATLQGHSTYGNLETTSKSIFILKRTSVRHVDLQKAFSVILGNVYKTLYNILARRRAEREISEVSVVLEKCERSDVSQDESLLTRLERNLLNEWQTKQTKLGVLEMRVEQIVFLLKDLGAVCISE